MNKKPGHRAYACRTLGVLRSAFREWAERHNLPATEPLVNVRSWIATSALGACLVLLAGVAPGVSALFQLRTLPALMVLLVVTIYSILAQFVPRVGNPAAWGVVTLVGNAMAVCFAASLVALSSVRGATAFALLPVFVAAYHGHLLRTGLRYPYGALATLMGIGGAVALDPSRMAIFAIVTPLAVGMNLTLGTFALKTHELGAERERLRAAIAAQQLNERRVEVEQLSSTLLDVLGKNHDLGTSLSAARLNSDWLQRQTVAPEVRAAASEISASLERVASVLAETRKTGREAVGKDAELVAVDVAPVLARVVSAVRRTHRARVAVVTEEGGRGLVRGGVTMLERIVENIVVNACEGDGKQAATEVRVSLAVTAGRMTIEVVDDGPGFEAEALKSPITAFVSSKQAGTGLGLYTAERLVSASGGTLSRANGVVRGAIVSVQLVSA